MADSHGDSDELTGKHLQMGVWGSQPCLMEEWEELIIKNHPEAGSRMSQESLLVLTSGFISPRCVLTARPT